MGTAALLRPIVFLLLFCEGYAHDCPRDVLRHRLLTLPHGLPSLSRNRRTKIGNRHWMNYVHGRMEPIYLLDADNYKYRRVKITCDRGWCCLL